MRSKKEKKLLKNATLHMSFTIHAHIRGAHKNYTCRYTKNTSHNIFMLLEYAKIEKVPAYTSLIMYLITYSAKIVPRTLIWQPYNTFGYNWLNNKT